MKYRSKPLNRGFWASILARFIQVNQGKKMQVNQGKLSKTDMITIIEIARVALEYENISRKIAHELNLSDEEINRIYSLIEIKDN